MAYGYGGEAITISQAIRPYTYMGAWLSWEEKTKGSLEPGKYADMIVLDTDPLTAPPQKLLITKVERTYIAGRLSTPRPRLLLEPRQLWNSDEGL